MCLACEIYGRFHGLADPHKSAKKNSAPAGFVAAAGGDPDFAATAEDAEAADLAEQHDASVGKSDREPGKTD